MLEILERIVAGNGTLEDLDLLEELGQAITDTALCGLGKSRGPSGTQYVEEFPSGVHRACG